MTMPSISFIKTQAPILMANTRTLAKNYLHTLPQNHSNLRSNVLIFSSLILVLSRIAIAKVSAQKAQDKPDGNFRYREFIRTFIREAAGWTLSFMLLRSIEKVVRYGVIKAFKIHLAPAAEHLANVAKPTEKLIHQFELKPRTLMGTFGEVFGQVKQVLKGKPLEISPLQNATPYYGSNHFSFDNHKLYDWLENRKVMSLFSGFQNLSPLEKVKQFYRYFPIVVGSIPAIALSGYALERFNIDHSQKIFDALAARKNKRARNTLSPATLVSQPVSPTPPVSPVNITFADASLSSSNSDRFASFIQGIRDKQAQRGMA